MRLHFLALAALLASTAAAADTLVSNINGIQVGADGKLQQFTGLLIGEDGKVKRVLRGEKLKLRDTEVVDGGGRTVLPGLIDAHGHVGNLGLLLTQLDLVGTASLDELKAGLAAYAAANSTGWIVGRGWNQELWPSKAFPTAADLDAVVADRPVWLERVDGHAAVLNSAALKAAGITAASRDPAGGKIERDASGKPTGLLVDAAAEASKAAIPQPTNEQRDRMLDAAQQALLGVGLTAVADMGTEAEDWRTFARAGEAGRLQIRIMVYASALPALAALGRTTPTEWLYGDRLRLGGVKLYTDGALGSRGAWLKRPYADKPDSIGLRFLSDAELKAQAGKAAAMGFQLAIHAIGDAANEQVIRTFEALQGEQRPRIEHVQVVDPADIPRLAKAGIIASMQPTHQTSDRTMVEKRLDPPRLEGAYAWQTIIKSGARIAFGSDFPVESPNPFPGLSAAISRQGLDGQPPGGWRPHERVSFAQALGGFTRDAAYAGFAERKIGSLEPGQWADFIIVDRDVSQVDAQALARTEVLETWVAGKKVWARTVSGGPGERGR